jgi:hypothetical protein
MVKPSENELHRFRQELRFERRKAEKKAKIGAFPRFCHTTVADKQKQQIYRPIYWDR